MDKKEYMHILVVPFLVMLKEKIRKNKEIFNSKELKFIQENEQLIIKIYGLGSMSTTNIMLGGNV